MRVRLLLSCSCLFTAALFGCAGANEEATAYQSRVIPGSTTDELIASAEVLLKREFPRVSVDRARHQLNAEPVEFTTTRDSMTANDLVGGRSTMRRKGRFSVANSAEGPVARVRIEVERQDTARQEQLAQSQSPDRGFGDSPAQQTPIQRDAGVSRSQNAVWTFVRRDRNLERNVLDDLARQYERRTPEGRAESPTSAPQ